LPLCFGADAPWEALVPEAEFNDRVDLTADQCVVDGEHFFVRGHIELPIIDSGETFTWSVWVSLSKTSFRDMTERWDDPNREGDAYFGYLCTSLSVYPNTIYLKTTVTVREVGLVPLIEIQEREHPLYIDQRDGLTSARVEDMVHTLLHDE